MSALLISGASDDLVEIDGLISDEFNVYGPALVTVKVDGVVHLIARVEYGEDAEWRVEAAGDFPAAYVTWSKALGEDFPDQRIGGYRIPAYSDVLIVHMGDIEARRIDVTCEATS